MEGMRRGRLKLGGWARIFMRAYRLNFELALRSCGARPNVLMADRGFLETRTLIQAPDAEPIGGETRPRDLLSIRNTLSCCVLTSNAQPGLAIECGYVGMASEKFQTT